MMIVLRVKKLKKSVQAIFFIFFLPMKVKGGGKLGRTFCRKWVYYVIKSDLGWVIGGIIVFVVANRNRSVE
jgi:hypothetical protein